MTLIFEHNWMQKAANNNTHYLVQTAAMPEMHTLECKNLEKHPYQHNSSKKMRYLGSYTLSFG